MDLNSPLPIDRGWAWVLTFGGMMISWLVLGMLKVAGIILVEVKSQFNATALQIAVIIGLRAISESLFSIIVMGLLVDLLHMRVLMMIGGSLISFGYMVCYFAYNIYVVYVQFALMGLGLCMVWGPMIVNISHYFDKKLSLANAILTSGASIGTISTSHLLKFLLDTYGFQGALLIIGAMSCNVVSFATLFRPPEFYNRFRRPNCESAIDGIISEDTNNLLEPKPISRNSWQNVEEPDSPKQYSGRSIPRINEPDHEWFIEMNDNSYDKNEDLFSCTTPDGLSQHRSNPELASKSSHSKTTLKHLSPSRIDQGMNYYSSMASVSEIPVGAYVCANKTGGKLNSTQHPRRYSVVLQTRDNSKKLSLFDVTLLKDKSFTSFIISSSLYFSATSLHIPYLSLYASESGMSLQDITTMISICGVFELFGRFLFGFLGDSTIVSRHNILIINCVTYGIFMNCGRLFSGFWPLLIYFCLSGIMHTCYAVINVGVIVKFFGQEALSKSWGVIVLLRGFILVGLSQLIGYLHKVTEGYASSLNMLGVACLLCGSIWTFITLPLVKKRQDRESEENRT